MQRSTIDVSIIVVNYKTPLLLKACIESIIDTTHDIRYEIIIVDNDSQDESEQLIKENFSDVIWINSGYNAGFARANNIGIHQSVGEYILLLNPDTSISQGFLPKLLSFYKLQNIQFKGCLGMLTTRIISSIDQSLLVGSGRKFVGFRKEFAKNPFYILVKRILPSDYVKYDATVQHYQNHEIDFASGACILIEKSKIVEHNLFFDEDFFLYFEDLELSFRTKKSNLRNYFCSELEIAHVNSASTSQSKNRSAQITVSEYLYFCKRYNRINYFLLGYLMLFNFWLNMLLLKRKNEMNKLEELKFEKKLFDEFYFKINKQFGEKNNTNRVYLKYDS